jgi:CBS domain-containing protein
VIDAKSTIGCLVARPPVWVQATVSLGDAARVMRDASVSSALVGPEGAIITERDLARAVAAGVKLDGPVTTMLSRHPVRVSADMPIVEAAAVMLNEEVRHLVVDFAGGAVGIVSLRDVTAVLLQTTNPHIWLSTLRIAVEEPRWTWL